MTTFKSECGTEMQSGSIFDNISKDHDGSYVTTYGEFELRTALQPIFGQDSRGKLELTAFEGLVRASRNGAPFPPGQFFASVSDEDMPLIDSLCRTLHILNMGQLQRRDAKLFVNFHPGLFVTLHDIRNEVDRISVATYEAGLTPDRVVCEIARAEGENPETVALLTNRLRGLGFKIAVDEYGAEDSDAQRLEMLTPNYVKFEASWVLEFMENPTGYALLKMMVEQFKERNISPIFEGLEEISQVDLCQELGVPLMQGYVLARPEIAPTSFNEQYPDTSLPQQPLPTATAAATRTLTRTSLAHHPLRRQAAFGKRRS